MTMTGPAPNLPTSTFTPAWDSTWKAPPPRGCTMTGLPSKTMTRWLSLASVWSTPGTVCAVSVPRMPMVASGLCILKDSGFCLTISPVTARKVPWAILNSAWPEPFPASNTYWSRLTLEPSPTFSTVLSRNWMEPPLTP